MGVRVDFDATDVLGATKDGVVTASDVAEALLPPDRCRDGVGARVPRTFDPVSNAGNMRHVGVRDFCCCIALLTVWSADRRPRAACRGSFDPTLARGGMTMVLPALVPGRLRAQLSVR